MLYVFHEHFRHHFMLNKHSIILERSTKPQRDITIKDTYGRGLSPSLGKAQNRSLWPACPRANRRG